MARVRQIKPGFFKNEDLAECSPWARLCFAGLWVLADREGRLEDRPKRIKGELFAFDSIEVEPLLTELEKQRFIERYKAADGRGFIQVVEFVKHQNPHHREPKSDLPSPKSPGLLPDATAPKPEASATSNDSKAPGQPRAGPRLLHDETSMDGGQAGRNTEYGIRKNPPTPRRGENVAPFPPGFAEFWAAYPRKTAKPQACKAFARLGVDQPLLARMLAAIAVQRTGEQWRKDGGEFIPHPATWLNNRRWEDEGVSTLKSSAFEGAV